MICLMHIYLITAQNPAFCCLMVTFHWVFKTLKMLTTSYWQFLVLVISSSCSSTDLPPFLKCSNASNKLNRRQKVLQMFGSWTILLLQGKSTHTTVQCCLSPTQDIIDPIWEFHAGQPVYQILSYSKAKAGQIQSWNIKCITLKSLLYLILFNMLSLACCGFSITSTLCNGLFQRIRQRLAQFQTPTKQTQHMK